MAEMPIHELLHDVQVADREVLHLVDVDLVVDVRDAVDDSSFTRSGDL